MDRLRALLDFDDLDATEGRLRALLVREKTDAGRAEVVTQLARVEGLRGRFGEGEALLRAAEAAAGASAVARARIDLERGRLLRSSGEPAAALPLFEAAFETALAAGEAFVAADAAHMAALAGDGDVMEAWAQRGIELAEASAGATYWLGPLLNNLGWARYEAGEHERALDAFERALAARERDPQNAIEIRIARYCAARTLRALGRLDEAERLLEEIVVWAERDGEPDAYFVQELAEVQAELEHGAG